jgi:phage I-like protein
MWHTLFQQLQPGAGIVQMFPHGIVQPTDGRKAGPWRMDAQRAAPLIAAFKAAKNPLAIDYEHQSLMAAKNGQPAPAAGWIVDLEYRDGEGLFATVEWTERAAAAIKAGEYRYFSPVFADKGDRITKLGPGALTNNPALDGMAPVIAASALSPLTQIEEPKMEELLKALRQALGLAPDADEPALLAAFNKHLEEVAKLREKPDAQAMSGNAAFVPIAQFEALKADFVQLSAQIAGNDLDALVKSGLADGRLLPMQEKWARGLSVQALSSYLQATPAIAALRGGQTRGGAPAQDDPNQLSAEELQVCSQLGLTQDAFIAARTAS